MRGLMVTVAIAGGELAAASLTLIVLSGSLSSILTLAVGVTFAVVGLVKARQYRSHPEAVPEMAPARRRLVFTLFLIVIVLSAAVAVVAVVASL